MGLSRGYTERAVLIEVIQELVKEWSPQGISQYPELEKRDPQGQSRGYTGAGVHNVHCTMREMAPQGAIQG